MIIAIILAFLTSLIDYEPILQCATNTSNIFIGFLKIIGVPIVFLSVVTSISKISEQKEFSSIGRKTLFYTIVTTLIAASIALMVYMLLRPSYQDLVLLDVQKQFPTGEGNRYFDHFLKLIPDNFLGVFVHNNVIGALMIAVILGFSLNIVEKEYRNVLKNLFASLFDLMLKFAGIIIKFLPIAIWSFVVLLIKDLSGDQKISHLLVYCLCIIVSNLIQAVFVLPVLLKIKGIDTKRIFEGSKQALALAFFSKSSSATLPVTINCVKENLKVRKDVAGFVLPMCSVINMNACASFILITFLFISEQSGIHFSAFDFISWIFLATIAAIGNASVPMGCYFMTMSYLVAFDVPVNIMFMILPLYSLIDMLETAINVWSDICITSVIDKDSDLK